MWAARPGWLTGRIASASRTAPAAQVASLPATDLRAGRVEDPLVVPEPDLSAGFALEGAPQGFVLVEDLHIFGGIGWGDLVGAEQKPIRITIDESCSNLYRFGAGNDIFGHFIPREIEIAMSEAGIA